MAQTTMYQGINNSPKATLTAGITAADQIIPISDASFFPDGPNIATIGVEDDAELIRYAAKSGNTLTGCERGFHGTTAKVWNQSDVVYRGFTLYDHDAFRSNIADLVTSKLDKPGDGSDVTAGFTAAASRVNVATGEKLSVLFGKVAKWLADLKALAFKATVSTSDIDAAAVTNAKLSNMTAGTLKGNNAGAAAAPIDIDAAGVRTMLNVADGADVTRTVIEGVSAVDALANEDTILLNDASAGVGSKTKSVLWSAIKILLNALYAPLAHASRHASGGADAITPAVIGATVTATATATLTVAGWSSSSQIVSVTGVTASNSVVVSPAVASHAAYGEAGVYCSAQGAGTLTFACEIVPTATITVNVLILI